MKFSSNNTAQKNGFWFELRYSQWLDDEQVDNPWYIYCARIAGSHSLTGDTCTERSFRFPNEEQAKAFCEKVASGAITLEQLMAAEKKAWDEHRANIQNVSAAKVNAFFEKMVELGLDPVIIPDVVHAYQELNLEYDVHASTFLISALRF